MGKTNKPYKPPVFNSLFELNKVLGLPEPLHPLITISNFYEATEDSSDLAQGVILGFYQIAFKKFFSGSIKYGQNHYDFQNGGLWFIAPNQLLASSGDDDECEGLTLLIHPDFLQGFPLAQRIKTFGFFSYAANEALQLSEKESKTILSVFDSIEDELTQRIDKFSQSVVISQIELLLNYSDRFYDRQFITRKAVNDDLLYNMDEMLNAYFKDGTALHKGLPSVQQLAEQLKLSPRYLSDMLRTMTGMNAQQHVHQKVIELTKEQLALNRLTVSEIAYNLGFEHPQSFSKFFKQKAGISPKAYKQSLN